jgi:hypothetical protein
MPAIVFLMPSIFAYAATLSTEAGLHVRVHMMVHDVVDGEEARLVRSVKCSGSEPLHWDLRQARRAYAPLWLEHTPSRTARGGASGAKKERARNWKRFFFFRFLHLLPGRPTKRRFLAGPS